MNLKNNYLRDLNFANYFQSQNAKLNSSQIFPAVRYVTGYVTKAEKSHAQDLCKEVTTYTAGFGK